MNEITYLASLISRNGDVRFCISLKAIECLCWQYVIAKPNLMQLKRQDYLNGICMRFKWHINDFEYDFAYEAEAFAKPNWTKVNTEEMKTVALIAQSL